MIKLLSEYKYQHILTIVVVRFQVKPTKKEALRCFYPEKDELFVKSHTKKMKDLIKNLILNKIRYNWAARTVFLTNYL